MSDTDWADTLAAYAADVALDAEGRACGVSPVDPSARKVTSTQRIERWHVMSGYILELGVDSPTGGRVCVGEAGPFSSPVVAEAWAYAQRGRAAGEVFDLPMTEGADEMLTGLELAGIAGWTLTYYDGEVSFIVSETAF